MDIEILNIGGKGGSKRLRDFLKVYEINSSFIGDFDNIKEFGITKELNISLSSLAQQPIQQTMSKLNKQLTVSNSKDGQQLFTQLNSIVTNGFQLSKEDRENLKDLWTYLIEKHGSSNKNVIDYLQKHNSDLLKEIRRNR